ncbi:M20 family peptidase [Fulvivirga lutimaris]|uniref:M20 family peptidase n=1 Tax=Fulvivirga lutimaris TaxID=1819566 RepID=UPI0012BC24F7|nr:M20 family peptidase [Fulvivirga lutimaris]MTI41071.1 M20/M25/M40 family metallo-hydrolase [Fulvivirga lutimaris]
MKKILLGLLAIVIALVLFVLIKTVLFTAESIKYEKAELIEVPDAALERLKKAIQYKTISYEYPGEPDSAEFIGLHNHIATAYPLVDSLLEKEVIADYSLLFKWQGSDGSAKPIILMGHMDVVPVDQNTLAQWEAPPFSGEIKDGIIYGRGTMDDKVTVFSILEAVEMALQNGVQPKQTIYLAFGHDEEIGGESGAGAIAEFLEKKGVKAEYVMDEGGYIGDGVVPGINDPVAIINVAEKGYVSFKLTITTPGGHSSNPPADNTIGSLAAAITRLEENQFPYRMTPVVETQIATIGPHMPFVQKMAFANTWLLGTPILKGLNAHTTTAPTIFNAGVKDNVIPTTASVVMNFRIMPGESVESVRQHVIETVNDERVTIESISNVNEPSPVSDYESEAYSTIAKTVKQVIPEAIVSPGLLGGGTDTKHYRKVSENQYRFLPIRISPDNMTGFHGINEHLQVENYKETVQFFYQLLKNLQEGE